MFLSLSINFKINKQVVFRNRCVCSYAYIRTITSSGKRGHEFKEEQESGLWEAFGGKNGKGEMQLFYNLKQKRKSQY